MSENNENTVEIAYSDAKQCPLVPVSGAWGGKDPQGNILVNCYYERATVPHKTILPLQKNSWVDSGSGRSPMVWNRAVCRALKVLNP